ncbi:MAG: hypothetical protein ACKO15_11290, partial [Burkholderiales bacterium]
MPLKHPLAVSLRRAEPSSAQETERPGANTDGTSVVVPSAAHLAIQRKEKLGIQQSPYAAAQRRRIAGLTQRQEMASAPKADEDELSGAVQTKAA